VEERKIVYAAVLNAAMQPLVWHTLVGKYKHPFYPTLTCFYSGLHFTMFRTCKENSSCSLHSEGNFICGPCRYSNINYCNECMVRNRGNGEKSDGRQPGPVSPTRSWAQVVKENTPVRGRAKASTQGANEVTNNNASAISPGLLELEVQATVSSEVMSHGHGVSVKAAAAPAS
jgi:hypothetical protein